MKISLNILSCLLISIAGFSQDTPKEQGFKIPSEIKKSETLKKLYKESETFDKNTTVAEIKANRLSIKQAWQSVDPKIAALYKQVDKENALPETEANVAINGVTYPDEIKKPRKPTSSHRDWGEDIQLREGYVDGVDMDVDSDGAIYVASYTKYIDFGGTRDTIYVHRSVDHGATFEEWKKEPVTAAMRKLQLISYDALVGSEKYIVAYFLTDSGTFQAFRWNTNTGDFDAQAITTDVSDFSVSRTYQSTIVSLRTLTTYLKDDGSCEKRVYSARSQSGSYGFDFVDETPVGNICGEQIEMFSNYNDSYTTFLGANSGNLYAVVNGGNNDPASWNTEQTLELGNDRESREPVIVSEKPEDVGEIFVLCSSRAAGSTDSFDAYQYKTPGNGDLSFGNGQLYLSATSNNNLVHVDAWTYRNDDEVSQFQSVFVSDDKDDLQNNELIYRTYTGTEFTTETVIPTPVDVFDGYAPAIAETEDGLPCVVFSGTSDDGLFGENLYFDAKTEILSTSEVSLNTVQIYPNPVEERINIAATKPIQNIKIRTSIGETIKEIRPNKVKVTLPFSFLQSGVYLVTIETKETTHTRKIIKN